MEIGFILFQTVFCIAFSYILYITEEYYWLALVIGLSIIFYSIILYYHISEWLFERQCAGDFPIKE